MASDSVVVQFWNLPKAKVLIVIVNNIGIGVVSDYIDVVLETYLAYFS